MRGRRAFTLVELLVVIGLTALLLSLTLGVSKRFRAEAQNTQCLSNLRQIGHSYLVYALANEQSLPIGYCDVKQFNYLIWHNGGSGKYAPLNGGFLYVSGLMPVPEAFFCPSETNPGYSLGASNNPWPPSGSGPAIRGGYSNRPLFNWTITASGWTPWLNSVARWPRIRDFKAAIVSDTMAVPGTLVTRHQRGVNVLYVDGSARTVLWPVIQSDLASITTVVFSGAFDANMDRIWAKFDQ